MLKGISLVISPELLKVLSEMGNGDEIILADTHFYGNTFNTNTFHLGGIQVPAFLSGILPLFELNSYCPNPLIMMAAVEWRQIRS